MPPVLNVVTVTLKALGIGPGSPQPENSEYYIYASCLLYLCLRLHSYNQQESFSVESVPSA